MGLLGKMSKNTKASKGKRKQSVSVSKLLADYFVQGLLMVFVFFILCLYPLMFHDKYFDMGAAKYKIFLIGSSIGLSLITFFSIWWLAVSAKKELFIREQRGISSTDIAAVAFLLLSVLSFFFSADWDMAFWGYDKWNMGLLSQIFFILIYYYVSRFWQDKGITMPAALIAAAICYQIGIWQRFGFNPLGMYDGVGEKDIAKFLSTLGQTSWYSSYAVLIIPFGMYLYWKTENRTARILSGLFVCLGYGMLCTTNSDSAYVAVVLILMVFFRYSLENNERLAHFLELVFLAFLSFRVIHWMRALLDWEKQMAVSNPSFGDAIAFLLPERTQRYVEGEERITQFVTGSPVMLVGLVLSAAACIGWRLYLKRKKEKKEEAFEISRIAKPVWRVTVSAAVLVIWLVLLLTILVSKEYFREDAIKEELSVQITDKDLLKEAAAQQAEQSAEGVGRFLRDSGLYEVNFFRFNNAWGNHRGFNWRAAMVALSRASLKDMLIGVGPDCFALSMDKYYEKEVASYWHGLQLACAHNEWLNMLITEGILGLVAYVAIFITMFIQAARRAKECPMYIPCMGAIVAYMGHNIFCYQQCICTPVIFVILGMAGRMLRDHHFRGGEQEGMIL